MSASQNFCKLKQWSVFGTCGILTLVDSLHESGEIGSRLRQNTGTRMERAEEASDRIMRNQNLS